jgi:hypothetical protein
VIAAPGGGCRQVETVGRVAFFQVGEHLFADVLHNYDHPLEINVERLACWLASVDPAEIIIGRKLHEAELGIVLDNRDDVDADSYAKVQPDQSKLVMGIKIL